MEEAVRGLQDWIVSRPHLANCRADKKFLRVFYRGCNYNTEVFKAKYDLFYTVRSLLPEWFDQWDPTEEGVRKVLDSGAILPLRGYDKKGRFVMIVRQRFLDPAVITVDQLYKTFLMIFSIASEENYQAFSTGYVIIHDTGDITLQHAMMLSPNILKKHMVVFQDAYPMDHQILIDNSLLFIINMPGLLESFVTMVRSALDEKYRKILRPLRRQDTQEILKKEVGEEILPAELGGNNGTIDDIKEFWKEELLKHSAFLSKLSKSKTEESRRPDGPKTSYDLFGSCSIM